MPSLTLSPAAIVLGGAFFILFTLWALYVTCRVMGAFFINREKRQKTQNPSASYTQAPFGSPSLPTSLPSLYWQGKAPGAPASDEDEIALVIAAVVDRLLQSQAYRIISISPAPPSDWASQGRRDIFLSRHTF